MTPPPRPSSPTDTVARAEARTEEVRQTLRRELKLAGVRQAEASVELGMAENYLSNLFLQAGAREPMALRLDVVFALLEMIGVPPSRFFAEVERRGGWGVGSETSGDPTAVSGPRDPLTREGYEVVGRRVLELAELLIEGLKAKAGEREAGDSDDSGDSGEGVEIPPR